ncbi:MAG TPA: hypothetical protein DCS93_36060 [Microscillaceae bacterium]|nr:hypothetical protein [Microscillaceae bacterium]
MKSTHAQLSSYLFYKVLEDLDTYLKLEDIVINKEDLSVAFGMNPNEAKTLALQLLGGYKKLENLPWEIQRFFIIYLIHTILKNEKSSQVNDLLDGEYAEITQKTLQEAALKQASLSTIKPDAYRQLDSQTRQKIIDDLTKVADEYAAQVLKLMVPLSGDIEDWVISGSCRYHDHNGMILWEDFFWTFIQHDLVWMLDVLMQFGANFNSVFARRVLVSSACLYESPIILEAMLERGLDLTNPIYESVVLDAVGWNKSGTAILKILLKHGVNINVHHSPGTNWGKSPLQLTLCVPHVQEAKLLLKAGADVNALDSDGQNAPFQLVAGVWGYPEENEDTIELMQMILARKPDLGVVGKDGNSVIYQCAAFELETFLSMLMQAGASIDPRKTSNQYTPLLQACKKGNIRTLHTLLDYDADINAVDKQGLSGLHIAIVAGIGKNGFKEEFLETIDVLLNAGIDRNLATLKAKKIKKKPIPAGTTALMLAKELGVTEVVELLEN